MKVVRRVRSEGSRLGAIVQGASIWGFALTALLSAVKARAQTRAIQGSPQNATGIDTACLTIDVYMSTPSPESHEAVAPCHFSREIHSRDMAARTIVSRFLMPVALVLTACGGRAESNRGGSSDGGASSGGGESTGGVTSSGGAPAAGGATSGGTASWMGCAEDTTDQIGLTLDSESISALYPDAQQELLVSLAEGATATALVAGEFSAAAITGSNHHLLLWRGSEEIASLSVDSAVPLVARFLSAEGLFVAESSTTSYFLSVGASGSQSENLHVLDVPDPEGVAPAEWREGDQIFVGFVHLESGISEQAFLLENGEEAEFSHGIFLSINQGSQLIARTRAGESSLARLEVGEEPMRVHLSDAWGVVTRLGIPILSVDLETLTVTSVEPLGLDVLSQVPQVTSAGSYFLAHNGSDGWPLWRLDAASGALDVPQRDEIWDGEVWLLDSEECGRSTQVLADGRLGVALRDNSLGYFFLEEEVGSSQYSHRGVAIESPSHLRVRLESGLIVLEHDGGESSPCPIQEYSNADRTTLIPSIATITPTGVQLLGGGQFLSAGFEESAWGRANFSMSSDGSCYALRENFGWRVWSEMPLMGTASLEVDQVILR